MPKPTPLEDAFTSTFMDLHALRHVDLDVPLLHHHTREIDFAVGRLCESLSGPDADDDVNELAHRAHRAVLALAQALVHVDSDDRRARTKLDFARASIDALLDELGPLVSGADRALRDVLLRGESLESALQRMRVS